MARNATLLCALVALAVASGAAARLGSGEPEAESCSFMQSLVSSNFDGDENIWLCIGFRESSYIPTARNPFSGATGLFQVEPIHCGNMPNCPPAGSGCVSGLEDPYTNAACARSVYNAQGFGAWTTYPECANGGGPCQTLANKQAEADSVPMMTLHEAKPATADM